MWTTAARDMMLRHTRWAGILIVIMSLVFILSQCTTTQAAAPVETQLVGDAPTHEDLHATAAELYDDAVARQWDISPFLARAIRLAAAKHSIPYNLAFSLVWAESRFKTNARSWAGATGLTQVMPATGQAHCNLDPPQLLNPLLNLDCGFSYLSYLHSILGDWRLALIAYHRGPTRLSRELSNNLPHGTSEAYARSILSRATLSTD